MSTIFSPSFGNRPSFLVGREGVLDALLRGLATSPGSRERSVVMLGQRGSGKTVLLWELADRAAKMGYAVATGERGTVHIEQGFSAYRRRAGGCLGLYRWLGVQPRCPGNQEL